MSPTFTRFSLSMLVFMALGASVEAAENLGRLVQEYKLQSRARDKSEIAQANRLFLQAFNHFKGGKFEAALELFESGLALDPANGMGRLSYAEVVLRTRGTAQARDQFSVALELLPPKTPHRRRAELAVANIRPGPNSAVSAFSGKAGLADAKVSNAICDLVLASARGFLQSGRMDRVRIIASDSMDTCPAIVRDLIVYSEQGKSQKAGDVAVSMRGIASGQIRSSDDTPKNSAAAFFGDWISGMEGVVGNAAPVKK